MESHWQKWVNEMSLILFFELALIALFLGAIPLMINAYKGNTLSLHRLSLLVLFLTFDLILFGAFTRLTDSGLGCPDWPGCYGYSNPFAAAKEISLAQEQMPFGPVTLSKAWIEMLHRYFASGVGFLILSLAILSFLKRKTSDPRIFPLTSALFVLVCIQGAFGALTVTLKLQPLIVSIHLVLALILLNGLVVLKEWTSDTFVQRVKVPEFSKGPVLGLFILCLVQVILGAWVSTNYAVLACQDFPTCHGVMVPPMDFANGFSLWRELGKTSSGEYLSIEALTAIHWVHRSFAVVVFAAIIGFYVKYKKIAMSGTTPWHSALRKWLQILLILIGLQFITGLSNVVLNWPLIAALIHTGGAALILATLTQLFLLALPKSLVK